LEDIPAVEPEQDGKHRPYLFLEGADYNAELVMALIAHERTATFVKLMLYTFEDCHGPIIYTPQAKPTDDLHGMLRAPFSPMTGGTGKHIGIFNDCSVEALLYN